MGQYYRGAILDLNSFKKNEINVVKAFCCYSHNNGAKLMEHSYVTNGIPKNSVASAFSYSLTYQFVT